MKQIRLYLMMIIMAVFTLNGCHERYVTYSDAEYIMFADTMAIYPVQKHDTTFRIPVVSTVVRDYDRTFGVEVIDKGSNAIERKHYHLESNTITIPSGKNRTDVVVHGYYSNIEDTDSLGFELQLVMNDRLEMPLYGKNTKAVLMKSCPFDVNDFTGWCVLTSMFLYQYPHADNPGSYQRLIKTELIKDNATGTYHTDRILCKNMFNEGYDVVMKFTTDDPMKPFVEIPSGQVASDEGSFFGQTHGDNKILISTSTMAESVYYPCGKYLYVWTMMYVEDLGSAVGTVGHFYNIMEWVSDEEADRLRQQEGM